MKYIYKKNLLEVKVTNDKICICAEFNNKMQVDKLKEILRPLINQLANTQEKMKVESKIKKKKRNRN